MPLYKFLHSNDATYYLPKGSVRFTSFSVYRDMEYTAGRGIGDKNEARLAAYGSTWLDPSSPKHVIENMEKFGISNCYNTTFNGVSFVSELNAYVFCLSEGELDELRVSMQGDIVTGGAKYDACIKINSIDDLLQAIRKSRYEAGKIEDFFDIKAAKVKYKASEIYDINSKFGHPDPFKKDTFFERQKEYRIVLKPISHALKMVDRFSITVDRPDNLFEIVPLA